MSDTSTHHRPKILDIPFDRVTVSDVLERIGTSIRQGTFCHIVTPGPEFLMRGQHDAAFREVLQQAELSIPDGMGVILAARWLGTSQLTRIAGTDLMHHIFSTAERSNWKIFLYGSLRPGTVAKAAANALKRYPGLHLTGMEEGFRHWLKIPEALVRWKIRRSQADILFVGLGAPEQELWIARNRNRLGSVKVAIGVGGAFDYLAQVVNRAPYPIRALGLEWMWRLAAQPRRRWRRILTAVWEFPMAVLRAKVHFHAK